MSQGFSLAELMVVVFVLLVVVGGSFTVLSSGQSAWFTADATMQLEQELRQGLTKAGRELSESGMDQNSVMQVTITNSGGPGNSDLVKFAMPVVCQANGSVIDVNGDVAYWRAPLTFGCTGSSCMDADNDCNTIDYKSLEYRVDNSSQLVRRVLNNIDAVVRTDIVASNINDFQASLSANQKVVTLTLTGRTNSALNRTITVSKNVDVKLRNNR